MSRYNIYKFTKAKLESKGYCRGYGSHMGQTKTNTSKSETNALYKQTNNSFGDGHIICKVQ